MESKTKEPVVVYPSSAAQSFAWMRVDTLQRLLPFAVLLGAVQLIWHPGWLGVAVGWPQVQLVAGAVGCLVLAALATGARLFIARRVGQVVIPEGSGDLWLQVAYYALNAPLEEGFFRGLLQGGGGLLISWLPALLVATSLYSLYHRLGRWRWLDVAATAFAGIPLALMFRLLPGPPSLLAVSIAHFGATCGFMGPGAAALRRLRLV